MELNDPDELRERGRSQSPRSQGPIKIDGREYIVLLEAAVL
jgi:hypothetical protein